MIKIYPKIYVVFLYPRICVAQWSEKTNIWILWFFTIVSSIWLILITRGMNLFQELVSSNTNQRNWRGILIALLVIVVVLALIVTSVVLLTPPDDGPRIKGTRFKLQDIISHDFQPLRFNGTWVSGECNNNYYCYY